MERLFLFHSRSNRKEIKRIGIKEVSKSKIRIKSYDYGAYGKLKVGIRYYKDGKTILGKNKINPREEYIPIPYDEKGLKDKNGKDKGNCIADYWEDKNGYGNPLDDNDDEPIGNGMKGDGFSRYEEYRGCIINDVYNRLNPKKKDLFIFVHDSIISRLTDPLGTLKKASNLDVHQINKDEYYDEYKRVVNFNKESFNIGDQHGLFVIDDPSDPRPIYSYGNNGTPKNKTKIVISIEYWCEEFGASNSNCITDPIDPKILRMLIAHECFHGCSIFHHSDKPPLGPFAGPPCIMRYIYSDHTNTQHIPDYLCTTTEGCDVGRGDCLHKIYIKDN